MLRYDYDYTHWWAKLARGGQITAPPSGPRIPNLMISMMMVISMMMMTKIIVMMIGLIMQWSEEMQAARKVEPS